jgi:thymidylate synthase
MYWKGIVTELLWFLRGDTNIKYLVDNGCHIWDGDAYKNYCMSYKDGHEFYEDDKVKRSYTKEEFINKIKTDDEFAKKWGELGPVYGKQWRDWEYYCGGGDCNVDQIQNSINLLKTDPDSRRNRVNAWNVGELDKMTLPPCHTDFQFYTRELSLDEKWEQYIKSGLNVEINGTPLELKHMETPFYPKSLPQRAISLMWSQRSVDTFLGLPFNIASYGLLLEIIAKEVNMVPDELIGNLGDCHLYKNHIEQAKEQIGRDLTSDERYEYWLENCNPIKETKDYVKHLKPQNRHGVFNDYKVPKRTREPYSLPKLGELPEYLDMKDNWECYQPADIIIENYQSHPSIKAPLSN